MKDIKSVATALVGMIFYIGAEMAGRMIGGTIGRVIMYNLWFIPVLLGVVYLWKRNNNTKNMAVIGIIGYILYWLYKLLSGII